MNLEVTHKPWERKRDKDFSLLGSRIAKRFFQFTFTLSADVVRIFTCEMNEA